MARRLAYLSVLLLVLASSAAAGTSDLRDRQSEIQDRIAALRNKIASANSRSGVLTSQISLVTTQIRSLEDDVSRASAKLDAIENDLAVRRNKLAALTQIYQLQTGELNRLKREHAAAEARAGRRLVAIYQEGDPTTVDVVLASRSFADLLDQLDFLSEIGRQDQSIARELSAAKLEMRDARAKTNASRKQVAEAARGLERQLDAQLAERNRLVSVQGQLADARATKQRTLSKVEHSKQDFLNEAAALEQASRELAAKIQAAQRSSAVSVGGASPSGYIWPVAGPVTSTFGPRWGRMHEGIDISAPSGAPIRSAAAGTVIYAGWLGGYGNLVVVDHGGGVATAYAHMSSIASGTGQQVAQGQVIGYVGSTGHSTGPHLHFEVRINGQAVDPLGYL
ncbi:MAG: peptidoglycan DD-metalloendopeptidase family protein [Gaiellaceae bacterium]